MEGKREESLPESPRGSNALCVQGRRWVWGPRRLTSSRATNDTGNGERVMVSTWDAGKAAWTRGALTLCDSDLGQEARREVVMQKCASEKAKPQPELLDTRVRPEEWAEALELQLRRWGPAPPAREPRTLPNAQGTRHSPSRARRPRPRPGRRPRFPGLAPAPSRPRPTCRAPRPSFPPSLPRSPARRSAQRRLLPRLHCRRRRRRARRGRSGSRARVRWGPLGAGLQRGLDGAAGP